MKPFASLVSAFALSALFTGTVASSALLLSVPSRSVAKKAPKIFLPANYPMFTPGERCATKKLTLREKAAIEATLGKGGEIATVDIQKGLNAVSQRVGRPTPISPNVIIIPVYVHVIEGITPSKINAARIAEQIDVLNNAFGGRMVKRNDQIASEQATSPTRFRFALKEINRVQNEDWEEFSVLDGAVVRDMKASLRRGGPNALNIYTSSIYIFEPYDGLLGFATFPTDYRNDSVSDGVVVHFDAIPGGRFDGYNIGGTTVHEVGHWMGLYHTFQDDTRAEACVNDNDFVADTPIQFESFAPDPILPGVLPDSCQGRRTPGRDARSNFMNYTSDAYMFQFTAGQSQRMSVMGSRFRNL